MGYAVLLTWRHPKQLDLPPASPFCKWSEAGQARGDRLRNIYQCQAMRRTPAGRPEATAGEAYSPFFYLTHNLCTQLPAHQGALVPLKGARVLYFGNGFRLKRAPPVTHLCN